jgi:fatty acid desaturase
MNYYLPWFIGLFFGQTPETYASHHLGMHHRENNLEDDLSSTMKYQRDSLKDFGRYFLDFFFTGVVSLAVYFKKRKQTKLSIRVIRGELFFILMCVGLWFISWPATLMVFIIPLLLSRIVMMMGNWAQHSFVDAEDPGNDYKNSITCINAKYNHKCWNDGYHISHHIRPAMHWTDHPSHLQNNLEEYAKNKALVFEGVDFLFVWKNLMFGNYDVLKEHLVNINDTFASDEEAIALMKRRVEKISA